MRPRVGMGSHVKENTNSTLDQLILGIFSILKKLYRRTGGEDVMGAMTSMVKLHFVSGMNDGGETAS